MFVQPAFPGGGAEDGGFRLPNPLREAVPESDALALEAAIEAELGGLRVGPRVVAVVFAAALSGDAGRPDEDAVRALADADPLQLARRIAPALREGEMRLRRGGDLTSLRARLGAGPPLIPAGRDGGGPGPPVGETGGRPADGRPPVEERGNRGAAEAARGGPRLPGPPSGAGGAGDAPVSPPGEGPPGDGAPGTPGAGSPGGGGPAGETPVGGGHSGSGQDSPGLPAADGGF